MLFHVYPMLGRLTLVDWVTYISEKIEWIRWKMRRFVRVFMFVCVCCESETEKKKQNCEKTHDER